MPDCINTDDPNAHNMHDTSTKTEPLALNNFQRVLQSKTTITMRHIHQINALRPDSPQRRVISAQRNQ